MNVSTPCSMRAGGNLPTPCHSYNFLVLTRCANSSRDNLE